MTPGLNPIIKYFPGLTVLQQELFARLKPIYTGWNAKINLISRQDMENFYIHHVLFSLSIAKAIQFIPCTKIIDIGTGGGFPGIPLAILFPDCQFTLLDSIGKKIKVVMDVTNQLSLSNVQVIHSRSENYKNQFDFILGRAVTAFPDFCRQNIHLLKPGIQNTLPNGIIYLTGGETRKTGLPVHTAYREWPLVNWFSEEFFMTKKIIYLSQS